MTLEVRKLDKCVQEHKKCIRTFYNRPGALMTNPGLECLGPAGRPAEHGGKGAHEHGHGPLPHNQLDGGSVPEAQPEWRSTLQPELAEFWPSLPIQGVDGGSGVASRRGQGRKKELGALWAHFGTSPFSFL